MIKGWRKAANRPGRLFFFVQRPAYGHPNPNWSCIRAAQTVARETLSNAGMAVAIDLGKENDIHPTNKQPVGERRLIRLALNQVYGQDVIARGPAFQTLEKDGSTMRVVFQGSEKGLETRDNGLNRVHR